MGVKNHWEIQKKQKKQNVETYGPGPNHRSPHFVFLFFLDFPMVFHPHWSLHLSYFVFFWMSQWFLTPIGVHILFFCFPNGFQFPLVSTFNLFSFFVSPRVFHNGEQTIMKKVFSLARECHFSKTCILVQARAPFFSETIEKKVAPTASCYV